MQPYFWNNWYSGSGWFLWFGVWFLMIFSMANWGYTYRAHRRFGDTTSRNAIDVLNSRYASGEIDHDEYLKIKSHILADATPTYISDLNRSKQKTQTSSSQLG